MAIMPHKPNFSAIGFKFLFNKSFLMCLGLGINLRPLDKRKISSLDKWRLDKLITLGLTNLPSHLPSNTVATLDGFSKEGWL